MKYISTTLDKNGGTLKFAIKVSIIILWNTIPILNKRERKYKLRVREFWQAHPIIKNIIPETIPWINKR